MVREKNGGERYKIHNKLKVEVRLANCRIAIYLERAKNRLDHLLVEQGRQMDLANQGRNAGVFAEFALANDVLERSSEIFGEHAINNRVLIVEEEKISGNELLTKKMYSYQCGISIT